MFRKFLLSAIVFTLMSSLTGCFAPKQPNILVMMADDLGRNDIGFYGNAEVSTPHLDALFRKGMVLDRMYVDSSCRPTRAALMTGLDPARLGYSTEGFGIPTDVDTMPRLFSRAGYKTSHIGKWHLGYLNRQARPNGLGFDYFHGFLDQGFLRGPQQEPFVYRRPPTYLDPWMVENDGAPTAYTGHLQDIITEMSISRIKNADMSKPWLVNIWFYAPHDPIEPAQRYLGPNPTPKDKYLALVKQLDDNVGAILKALEDSGQADDTLVVFLSDNGGTNAVYDNNAPFTGQKTSFKEGGVRTLGVLAGAGLSRPNGVYPYPIQHVDILPTLLDAAGIPTKSRGFDGQSHWASLNNGIRPPARDFFWLRESFFGKEFGALSGDGHWLLSREFVPKGDVSLQDVTSPELARRNQIDDPSLGNIKTDLLRRAKEWMHDRATLRLSTQRNNTEYIEVKGQDFLRTPGLGKNSFGFSLKGDWQTGQHLVAEQEGIWRLLAKDGSFEYQWGEVSLRAPIPQVSGGCMTVLALAIPTLPTILGDQTAVDAFLYINGGLAAHKRLDNVTFIPQEFPPTKIAIPDASEDGRPTIKAWTARNDLLYSNGSPFDIQASEVSDRLCKAP